MEMNEQLKNKYELDDKQNKEVTAGAGRREIKTMMHCDACGWEIAWLGDYMNGIVYDCPQCFAHAYHGIRHC